MSTNDSGAGNSTAPCPGVLLVEDDPDIRDTVRDLLVDEGYAVQTAVNGRHGLEVLEKNGQPCLILLDMMMPVMDGAGFLAEIRQRQLNTCPVIIVSAVAHRSEPGTVGFIRKPIDLDALLTLVKQYCAEGAQA
jgi:CheY-like chemotaxis protein